MTAICCFSKLRQVASFSLDLEEAMRGLIHCFLYFINVLQLCGVAESGSFPSKLDIRGRLSSGGHRGWEGPNQAVIPTYKLRGGLAGSFNDALIKEITPAP